MKDSSNKTEASASSHSDDSISSKSKHEKFDFGRLLLEARKAKNYSVKDVSQYLKIAAHIIVALETNDKKALPAPTYARGYIRAYAKFLEISEDKILAVYNRAVPTNAVSDLKPRSTLPGETNSQSPLIKAITILLIVAGIATLIFGSFQYYQKKADVLGSKIEEREQDLIDDQQAFSTTQTLNIQQNARLTDDDDLIVDKSDFIQLDAEIETEIEAKNTVAEVVSADVAEKKTNEKKEGEKTESNNAVAEVSTAVNIIEAGAATVVNEKAADFETEAAEAGSDSVEIFTETGSWVEVLDANNSRLFYNMLPEGVAKVLVGRAPFSISLGNARTARVTINDLEVDIKRYIRASNTANFEISTQGQNVIFH